jgi:hypothetical protein
VLGRPAPPGLAHHLAFRDRSRLLDADRPEVGERDGETVCGEDRDDPAVRRDRAREGDRAGDRRDHVLARLASDVDSPVLSRCVGVRSE